MRFEFRPGVLSDLTSDQDSAAFPVLTVTGAEPELELVSNGEPARLLPGHYLIEFRGRALGGSIIAQLRAEEGAPGGRIVDMHEAEPGVWRADLLTSRVVSRMFLRVRGDAVTVFFAGFMAQSADNPEMTPAPTLRDAAVGMGRAVFRKLPVGLRRKILAPSKRARWLAQVRNAAPEPLIRQSGGRIETDGACIELRSDLENRLAVARGARESAFCDADIEPPGHSAAKLIALYLPQFHPIPENDAWWGKGFTEWSNVAKAIPQFVGHFQPRLPGELGFYDLRTPGVLDAQARLARMHGVEAFCFHYYWFAGKRLLERPLDAFAADRSIDIEFCLCWANENWTRGWDGDESQVLIGQTHTLADHQQVFADFARYMEDPRYIRIDGKPLLLIYRPAIIPNARAMIALWRREASARGWPGIYLVATTAFRFDEAEAFGFDALAEFPPHGIVADSCARRIEWLNKERRGAVYDYGAVAHQQAQLADRIAGHSGVVFPGVMPGWDNEARRPGAGVTYHGATPEMYGLWLEAAVRRATRCLPSNLRLVFINAWNEWAEGAYLEPDRAFGRSFLAETARVMKSI